MGERGEKPCAVHFPYAAIISIVVTHWSVGLPNSQERMVRHRFSANSDADNSRGGRAIQGREVVVLYRPAALGIKR